MGYYSFYKIIKDIIHTIFGRKFFRLLLIIFIAICLCSPVFATSTFTTTSLNGNTYELPTFDNLPVDSYEYHIIAKVNTGAIYLICTYVVQEGSSTYPSVNSADDYSASYFTIFLGTTDYLLYQLNNNKWVEMTSGKAQYLSGVMDLYYSSKDIYNLRGDLVYSCITNSNPYFSNADDVIDYDFNNLYINMGDFTVDDVAYLHKLEVDRTFEEDSGTIYYKQTVWKLNSNSEYYGITNDLVSYYSFPRSVFNLSSNKEYLFVLNDNASSINATNGLYSDSSAYDILHLEPENSVITPDKEQNDAIKGNSDAINNLNNTITSNDYDENQIQIDSSLSDNIEDDNYTNFITTIINSINNAITCDWNTVETVQIPLGFVDESITWKSDLLSAHIPDSLKLIINTFWMFLFGFYIFKFSLSLVNWLKSGDILDGKGFNSDEVITSNML